MKYAFKAALTAVVTAGFLCAASTAAAETKVYDWPDEQTPVLIHNDSGILLIGGEKKPLRAFTWSKNSGEYDQPLRLLDLNGDGTPQIIGSGTPTFVTDASGEPIFNFEDGCNQVVTADLVDGSNLDLVCVGRTEVRVHTPRGSRAWSADIGRAIDWCRAGDLTGDTSHDLECEYRGGGQFVRFRGDGEVLTTSAEETGIADYGRDLDFVDPSTDAVFTGEESFDVDGDGSAGETLHAVDGALEIRKRGEEEPVARIDTAGDVVAAVVKDLDEDGQPEIVAVTDRRLYIISEGGEEVADFSADASDYSRVPHAEFAGLHTNGFGDSDDEVKEAVRAVQDDIAQCYGRRMRTAPFAGSGRFIMQVFVGEDGAVQQVNRRHSGIGDDTIEDCAENAIRGVDFPGAEEGRAMVNVNIMFSFRDEE